MNIMAPQYKEIFVDEQLIIVPSIMNLREILIEPNYLGLLVYSPGMKELISSLINFILVHEKEFSLGLYSVKYPQGMWMVNVLFKSNDGWQRVQIEHPKCKECSWRGAIANPTEPSLYFGVSSKLTALRRAHELPCQGCPCCGTPLGRHAIWTDKCNMKEERKN